MLLLFLLALTTSAVYAWLSNSLESTVGATSYVHKSYFESGDGTSTQQYNVSYDADGNPTHGVDGEGNPLASEVGCAFEIRYPVQLYYFAWLQNMGYFNEQEDGAISQIYFYLSDDLDMTGWVLPQIGTQEHPFVGNFDGNGHTVSNLTIQNKDSSGGQTWVDAPESQNITGLNIVGFFGVIGQLGTEVAPGGSGTIDGYTYSSSVNEVKNFIIEDAVIKTDLSESLVGIAAGYVNGTMENVKVVGGTISNVSATTALTTYTTNLSDFGAVGYCTEPYKGTNQVTTVKVYDPQAYTNSGSGATPVQGNNWGGSVEMQSMYEDLRVLYDSYTTPINGVPAGTNIIEITTDGSDNVESVSVTGDGTAPLTMTAGNRTYTLKLVEKREDGDAVAYYNFVPHPQGSVDFMYLYGDKIVTTESKTEGAVYIHTENDDHYFSINAAGAFADQSASASATKWIVKDGRIYTVRSKTTTDPESGLAATEDYLYYVVKNAQNALGLVEVSQREALPAAVTDSPWIVGEASVTTGGYALVYGGGVWTLEQLSMYISDNAGGNFLSVSSAPAIVNQTSTAAATRWIKESVQGSATGFYLATTVGGAKYYLLCSSGGALSLGASGPTVWYEEAPATGNHKVYMLTSESGGYALYYDVSNGWSTTGYTLVGQGNDWGGSIDMLDIHRRLLTIRDSDNTFVSGTTTYLRAIDLDSKGRFTFSFYSDSNLPNNYKYIYLFGKKDAYPSSTPTFFPLNTDEYFNPSPLNTGYIISGSTYQQFTNNPRQSGDIRVSAYELSNLSDSYTGTITKESATGYLITRNGATSYRLGLSPDLARIKVIRYSSQSTTNTDRVSSYWFFSNGTTTSGYLTTVLNYVRYYANIVDGEIVVSTTPSTTWTSSAVLSGTGYTIRSGDRYLGYDSSTTNWILTNQSNAVALRSWGSINLNYYTSNYDAGKMTIYARTATSNGLQSFTNNSRAQELGLQKYADARGSLDSVLSSGKGAIYGLHFMDATVGSTDVTIPSATINGNSGLTNYHVPSDCIDFNLKTKGYVNFFAGTYFENNDTFFSLYHIIRTSNTAYSVKEISEIYAPANSNGDYIYRYSDGTYSNNAPRGSMVFDMAWLTNPGSDFVDNRLYYYEIPVNAGEYALGSVPGKNGAYIMYLDISAAATVEGDSKIVDGISSVTENTSAGDLTYNGLSENEADYPTFYPLAWDRDAVRGHIGELPASSNTGYVISGSNTVSNPPGDIRVSRYTKYANTNWGSIRNSLTSANNAGVLNNNRVYTIINGGQQSITAYGIGNQYTTRYAAVAAEVNGLLRNQQYVYGLHFMQASISADNTVRIPKAVINGVTYTDYEMPEDSIDFVVQTRGRITFMAGTYFSGSQGTQSFFSLHRVFRDGAGNITAIRELSEIYGDGNAEHPYYYRYKGDAGYYASDGSNNSSALPAGYEKLYDTAAIADPTSLQGINSLTMNSVYYFEIPADPGEFALGSSSSDGAYLIYLDIAANADFDIKTTVTEVTETTVSSLVYPKGVAFVDAADSTAFDTNGVADPEKSVFLSIPIANSAGNTVFSITSAGAMTVTNTTSSLAGYEAKTIPPGNSLTVNNGTPITLTGAVTIREIVTEVDSDPNGSTVTTVTTTTQTTENGVTTTTVEQTVTTVMGATSNTVTTSPAPSYDGHALIPTDYTVQPSVPAQTILEYRFIGSGLTNNVARNGDLNIITTDSTVTVGGDEFIVCDVVKSTDVDGTNEAGRYDITISGAAGTYTVTVIKFNGDFEFYVNGATVSAVGDASVTVAA